MMEPGGGIGEERGKKRWRWRNKIERGTLQNHCCCRNGEKKNSILQNESTLKIESIVWEWSLKWGGCGAASQRKKEKMEERRAHRRWRTRVGRRGGGNWPAERWLVVVSALERERRGAAAFTPLFFFFFSFFSTLHKISF